MHVSSIATQPMTCCDCCLLASQVELVTGNIDGPTPLGPLVLNGRESVVVRGGSAEWLGQMLGRRCLLGVHIMEAP